MERKAHSDKAGVSTQTKCFSGRFRISTSSFPFCLELCRNVVSRIAKLKSYTTPRPINNKLHMLLHGCQSCPEPQTTPPKIEQRNRKLGLSVFFAGMMSGTVYHIIIFFGGGPVNFMPVGPPANSSSDLTCGSDSTKRSKESRTSPGQQGHTEHYGCAKIIKQWKIIRNLNALTCPKARIEGYK